MSPEEIYLSRVAQYGTTEDLNEPKALQAKQVTDSMKTILGAAKLAKIRNENGKKGREAYLERRRQKAQVSYEGVNSGE